jgi:hypothetical protein
MGINKLPYLLSNREQPVDFVQGRLIGVHVLVHA